MNPAPPTAREQGSGKSARAGSSTVDFPAPFLIISFGANFQSVLTPPVRPCILSQSLKGREAKETVSVRLCQQLC